LLIDGIIVGDDEGNDEGIMVGTDEGEAEG